MYQKFKALSLLDSFVHDPDSNMLENNTEMYKLLHDASAVEEEAGILERLMRDQKKVIEAFIRKVQKGEYQGLESNYRGILEDPGVRDGKQIEQILSKTLRRLVGFEENIRQIRGDAESVIKFVGSVILFKLPVLMILIKYVDPRASRPQAKICNSNRSPKFCKTGTGDDGVHSRHSFIFESIFISLYHNTGQGLTFKSFR